MEQTPETPTVALDANPPATISPHAEVSNDTSGQESYLPTPATTPRPPAASSSKQSGSMSDNASVKSFTAEEEAKDNPQNVENSIAKRDEKQLQLESELRDLKATLAAMVQKQTDMENRGIEFEETVPMTDEHRFVLQHRRYNMDSSDSDDDDDYTQFDQHRRQMERVFVRELKILKREKDMIKNIRSLRRDRDDLLEKEQLWERERVELEKANRQLEQQKLQEERGGQPPEKGADEGVADDEKAAAVDESKQPEAIPTPPVLTIPKLRYVEWSLFRALRLDLEENSFAIDVLKGEPVVTFDWAGYWGSRKTKRGRMKDDETKGKASGNLKKKQPGQAPLPERIRIHSKQILNVLEKICGDQLSSREEPLVMIRPFKFLVYYEDQIRQKLQLLKQKFGNPAAAIAEAPATSEIAATKSDPPGDEEIAVEVANSNKPEKQPQVENTAATEEHKEEEGHKEEDDPEDDKLSAIAIEPLECLIEFMDTEISQKLKYLASDACERVSFTDIWYLFKPGDEVVDQSRKQAYRVIEVASVSHKAIPPWRNYYDKSSAKADETPVSLHCVYIDFDGKNLGPVSKIFQIPRFDGEKAVTSLDVYPLRYVKPTGNRGLTFRQELIARGRMFLDVAGVKHMHYNGFTLDARDEIDSQVVVDFEEAFASRGNSDLKPTVEALIGESRLEREDDQICAAECCREENVHKDTDTETKHSRDYVASLIPEDRNKDPSVAIYPRALKDIRSPENELNDDELVIMSYRVFAFVLRSRKWALLDLTYLAPVRSAGTIQSDEDDKDGDKDGKPKVKEESAFEQLVLPPGHKEMVLSLIAQHFRDKESVTADTEQVDIVRGKGKGLILLLHGAPGVGKTTTAEGVAELFKKPLFQITCGDLGTTAGEVELALETNFALANRWGCILLLDEADVFLTSRSPQDFVRNGLVAVFLRVLEYYAGILFLTTNRIGDFDEAFASRVHISLHYPQLDYKSTRDIFNLNLNLIEKRFKKKGRDITIDRDGILDFAGNYWLENEKMRWNGRQIRNGCQTALALAEFEAQGGSHEHVKDAHAEVKLNAAQLETVSRAYLEFISYLTKLYGRDADRRAKAIGIRAREIDGKKDDQHDAREETPLKRSSAQQPSMTGTPGVAAARQPEPSPTPTPAYPPGLPGASLSPAQYPYPVYFPQQYHQMPQMPQQQPQPDATGYPPQPTDRPSNMPLSNQSPWSNMAPGPWQTSQQPLPGQNPYGVFPPGMQPPGFPQNTPPGDQHQQMPGGSMPPTTRG